MATVTPEYIDEEIKKQLLLLSDLYAQKNAFSPVFRLPPELLASIFTHGARDYYYHKNTNRPTSRIPCWVSVSYVCRHWRSVALSCPALWTYHFFVSPRWTKELLARSEQAPLKVYIPAVLQGRSRSYGHMKELLSRTEVAERIQELRLCASHIILPSKLSFRAPCLQTLDIDGTLRILSNPLTIDDWDIPPLLTLKLTGCQLSWHSLDLSGLTTLLLCRVPTPKMDITELLVALSRMHSLTMLCLNNALASACQFFSSGAFDVSPKVGLPYLTRLLVAGPTSAVVALLSCINIPLKTEIRLELDPEHGLTAQDYAKVPSFVARRFTQPKHLPPSSPIVRSLTIHYSRSLFSFTLLVSERDVHDPRVSMERPQWDSGIPLVIIAEMDPPMTTSDLDCIIGDICCSVPLTDVQTLCVTEPPLSSNFWRKMLGHLHGLRCLTLSKGFMPDLVPLLTLTADEPSDITAGDHDPTPCHMLIPALEELRLHSIAFAADDDLPQDCGSEKSLRDALATRKGPCPRLAITARDVESDESDTETSDYSDEY